jgi:hypothetical protein
MDLPLVAEGIRSTLSHPDDGDRGRPSPRLGEPLLKKVHVFAAPSRLKTASTRAAAGTGGLPDVLPRREWQSLATAGVGGICGEGGHISPGWCCSRGLPSCPGIARVDEVVDT